MSEQKTPSELDVFIRKFSSNLAGPVAECVRAADRLLSREASSFDQTKDVTSARLFQIAFGSWRSAVLLSLGGSASQVPIVLRHSLETVLYSFLLANDDEYLQKWWDREVNEQAKKVLRNVRTSPLQRARELLRQEDPNLERRVKESIDHFIDFGAHPNVFQLVRATQREIDETVSTGLLLSNEERQSSFLMCAGAALDMSDLFEKTWPARFDHDCLCLRNETVGQFKLFRRWHDTEEYSRS